MRKEPEHEMLKLEAKIDYLMHGKLSNKERKIVNMILKNEMSNAIEAVEGEEAKIEAADFRSENTP